METVLLVVIVGVVLFVAAGLFSLYLTVKAWLKGIQLMMRIAYLLGVLVLFGVAGGLAFYGYTQYADGIEAPAPTKAKAKGKKRR